MNAPEHVFFLFSPTFYKNESTDRMCFSDFSSTTEVKTYVQYNDAGNKTRSNGVDGYIPRTSDIRIFYGGCDAYRDDKNGTHCIATLVDVFARHAHDHHLDDLLKIVGQEISRNMPRGDAVDEKLIESISSEDIGFNKKLYFNP